jgi:hypothetical protein
MDKQRKGVRKICICGSRLALSAIAASLQEKPGFIVQKLESALPKIIDNPGGDLPDVILFDLATDESHFVIHLIHAHPSAMAIGIDLANKEMLALSGVRYRLLETEDLVQVIEAGTLK